MHLSVGYNRRCGVEVKCSDAEGSDWLDMIQAWLESEDTVGDRVIGYGFCFLTFIFLLFQCLRSFLL